VFGHEASGAWQQKIDSVIVMFRFIQTAKNERFTVHNPAGPRFVFHFVAGSPQHLLVPVRIIPSDKWKRGVSVSEEGKKLCRLQNKFLKTGEMSEEIEAVVETILFKF
jgi:hypothetical protein